MVQCADVDWDIYILLYSISHSPTLCLPLLLSVLLRALQMESMMGDSRQSVMGLQTQLEEYRDRSRKELLEAQRSSKDRLAELQRSQTSLKAQQDEVRTEWGGRMQ